jgi:hypothetical protein
MYRNGAVNQIKIWPKNRALIQNQIKSNQIKSNQIKSNQIKSSPIKLESNQIKDAEAAPGPLTEPPHRPLRRGGWRPPRRSALQSEDGQ